MSKPIPLFVPVTRTFMGKSIELIEYHQNQELRLMLMVLAFKFIAFREWTEGMWSSL